MAVTKLSYPYLFYNIFREPSPSLPEKPWLKSSMSSITNWKLTDSACIGVHPYCKEWRKPASKRLALGGKDIRHLQTAQDNADQDAVRGLGYVERPRCILTAKHQIALISDNTWPVHSAPCRVGPKSWQLTEMKIVIILKEDSNEPGKTERASPILFARKKDSSFWLRVHQPKVNTVTLQDFYRSPRTDECMESLGRQSSFRLWTQAISTANLKPMLGITRYLCSLATKATSNSRQFHLRSTMPLPLANEQRTLSFHPSIGNLLSCTWTA